MIFVKKRWSSIFLFSFFSRFSLFLLIQLSLTFDSGSEFADMTKIKNCQIYFAHPYSPWERGTNENCNGLLRQFFPKGKSMKDKTATYVQQATNAINHKHRRILQYHTAEELFKQYISS